MIIRKAKKEDIKEIDGIYCEGAFDEVKLQYPEKSKDDIVKDFNKHKKDRLNGFKKDIASKLNYWIVVVENNEMIGFGQAEIRKKNKEIGKIEKIYVSRKYRGKGVASKIMKELLKWLKTKVKIADAGIYIKNVPSVKLHEKFGFKVMAVGMQKKLRK